MTPIASFFVRGTECVIILRADLDKLVSVAAAGGLAPTARELQGVRLRAAREHAGLTQRQLAHRMDAAQSTVCEAESGRARVGDAFAARVMRACELPIDWEPPKPKGGKRPTSTTKRIR